MGKTSNIIVAVAAGLAAGIAIGFLLAPDKGSKTRRKIRQTIGDIGDHLEKEYAGMKERLEDVFGSDDYQEQASATDEEAPAEKPMQ